MNTTRRRGAIAWMAGNSVAANLLMLVCLAGGLVMGSRVKQEVFPTFFSDSVTVTVPYPGAGPAEVEQGIVLAVEEAVSGLEGVEEIQSTASEGAGTIRIEAIDGTDLTRFSQDVQSEVDRITSFPEDAQAPEVRIDARKREVISIAVFGEGSGHILREAAEQFRDQLLQDPAITQVTLKGVRDHEIHVEIRESDLRRYGLTLGDVAKTLENRSVETGGGSIDAADGEILIRMKDRRYGAKAYGDLAVVTAPDGSRIRLKEIATVREGFSRTDVRAFFNGKPAVMVDVYRVGDQTPVTVSDAAKRRLAAFQEQLPRGIDLAVVRDLSDIFRQRADLLLRNAYLGLGIVFVCLALFLEIRLAFWVSMGIPISFLGSFLILPATDFSINMVTMFAFIVTLGIVVDDAVVVGENVHAWRMRGKDRLSAAILGAKEVAVPVVFSVLSNIVAFLPLWFIPGIMGKIFGHIPIVVVAVFLISLVESLFILPAHLSHEKKGGEKGWLFLFSRMQERFSRGFTRMVHRVYGPFLARCLDLRYTVLAAGVAILLVTVGYLKSGQMGMELFPRVESDYAFCEAVLPFGAPERLATRVQKILVDGAKKVVAENGGATLSRGIYTRIRENEVQVRVYLTPPEVRPLGTTAVVGLWRKATGEIPGLQSFSFLSDRGGPGSGKGLTVELAHRDIPTLETAARALAKELRSFAIVKDVDDGAAKGKQQLDFSMRPEGERLGLTARDVARQLRNAYYGAEALKLQRGRNEVTVRVRLPEDERRRKRDLNNLVLRTPQGVEVLLRDVVYITEGRAYTKILRRDGRRTVSVTADVAPARRAGEVTAALQASILPRMAKMYPGLTWNFKGKQADLKDSTESLFTGLLLALMVIYVLLAVPFRSYVQPLIIMCCIPFGLVGAVMGHLLMGYSLSIISLFGIVALSGVVVNDSLVMIDFANRKRKEEVAADAAIWEAGMHRFRPILLTTITTFGGLSPMILETSRQARFLIPMAISLGFGILFATLITLVLVPALYLILEDLMAWRKPGA